MTAYRRHTDKCTAAILAFAAALLSPQVCRASADCGEWQQDSVAALAAGSVSAVSADTLAEVIAADTVVTTASVVTTIDSVSIVDMADPAAVADSVYPVHRDFGRAAMMVAGLNTCIWAFDWLVMHQDYAFINWQTITDNFKHGFVWDNDQMSNNMFLHPYHGSLYYNAARSNGFNFWQSGLFALGGSAMWEMVFENEYPSINDIIATPVGGTAIGEVTYRASDLVIRDDSRGAERFWREAAVLLIAPTRGLTRLITGDAWHVRSSSGRSCGDPAIALDISAGVRVLGYKRSDRRHDRGAGFKLNLCLTYGDRYELRSTRPYDYFRFVIGLSAQHSQPVLSELNILGRLLSREILDSEHQQLSLGLYQHFDYYDSDTISYRTAHTPYKLAVPASAGCGALYRWKPSEQMVLQTFVHINGIMLGAVLTDYYDVGERNYNLGSGFDIKSGLSLYLWHERLNIATNYEYYRLFTWGYPRGVPVNQMDERFVSYQGDGSVTYFGRLDLRADVRLASRLWLTMLYRDYIRSTRYRDNLDVSAHGTSFSLMLSYRF